MPNDEFDPDAELDRDEVPRKKPVPPEPEERLNPPSQSAPIPRRYPQQAPQIQRPPQNAPAPLPRRPPMQQPPAQTGGQGWPPPQPLEVYIQSPDDEEIVRQEILKEKTKESTREERIQEFAKGGIVELSDIWKQLKFLSDFPQIALQDVTGDPRLPANLRSGTANAVYILFNEMPLKQGRVYAPRPQISIPSLYYATNVLPSPGTNAPINLNGAAYTLTTATGSAAFKRFLSLELVFWTDSARTTKSTVAKDILLERLINNADGILLSRTTIYQATDGFNPTERNMSDLVFQGGDSIYIAPIHELRLTLGATGVDVWADAFIYVDVKN